MTDIVTAILNLWQKQLEALLTNDIGMNMVDTINATETTVSETLPTVLTVVARVSPQFRLSPVRIVLIIITVLLIITVTVSSRVDSASRPTENLKT